MNHPSLDGDAWLTSVTSHISGLVQAGQYREAERTILGLQACLVRTLKRIRANQIISPNDSEAQAACRRWMAVVQHEMEVLEGHLSVVQLQNGSTLSVSRIDE